MCSGGGRERRNTNTLLRPKLQDSDQSDKDATLLIFLTWYDHLMDYLASVSVAHDGLGLGDDCWCQMFSPEPVQDSDPDWTPPTLLLPHSAHLLPSPPLRSPSFTLDTETYWSSALLCVQVRVTVCTGYPRSGQLTANCDLRSAQL